MANITVKNIPDDVYAKIKVAAKDQHRSVGAYVLGLLTTRAKLIVSEKPQRAGSPIDIIEELRKLRARIGPSTENSTDILRRMRGHDS